ncbi:hypothetical protein OEIGOIKO_07658 [Streptomyces chrestomyceticus JCM 4735]|uniref:Uncharacterized protein n=1 Tax=Streptomyces chrestomyceticus JCM 4735 TaxID=1306181 RepID=A0A7U9Q0S2_9ACTN|nr:hypothetical protein [Streptomyces chrestomyceticus]GCD39802.1 hypothetical protein OEIGOIKO_07658 [Streptomyces chrestomyceticus JCM 4735]
MDTDTVNRELSVADQAIGREQCQGWITGDPTVGIERRPAPPDRTKALAENQIAALWRLDIALREKTQCWPPPSPHPTTSRAWTAEHSIGSATAP